MATENKGNFFQNNKKELIGTGIGAAGGALIGGLASRASARRRADELGLEGSERRRFIAGKTAAGAGIGTVAGGAAGFGASKIPFKGSKKTSDMVKAPGSKAIGAVPETLKNHQDQKLLDSDYATWKKSNPKGTERDFKIAQKAAQNRMDRRVNQYYLDRHNDKNDTMNLSNDQRHAIEGRLRDDNAKRSKQLASINALDHQIKAIKSKGTSMSSEEAAKLARLTSGRDRLILLTKENSNTFDNLNTLKMATIIFDEESRSFSVIEDHMYGEVKDHLKKYKTYYAGGATAVAGGTAAGIIAKKKARKEADRRGLTGAARKRFIAGRVAGAAAAGTVGGAAVGAGASIGYDYAKAMRGADIQSKYEMSAEEWKNLTPAERALKKKQAGWDKGLAKRSAQQRIKEAKEKRNNQLADAKTKEQKLRIKQDYQKAVLAAKKDTQSKALARKEAIRKGREGVSLWGITKKAFNPNNN